MTTHFELQPSETELQKLADQCWKEAPNRERRLEEEAFEAGEAIRQGDYSLANLEAIVSWKSERLVAVRDRQQHNEHPARAGGGGDTGEFDRRGVERTAGSAWG